MINPFREVNWRPDVAGRCAFGRSLVVGFPIIAAILLVFVRWKTGAWPSWPIWLGVIGTGVGLLSWAVPRLALPFYRLWYGVSCCIGLVVSNVIIAAVFYLAVTPIGLLLRLVGKDPLERRFDRSATSYWKPAEKNVAPGRYFRQF